MANQPGHNEIQTITKVLVKASDGLGYVLTGPARRVFRKTGKDTMDQIPAWELNVVLRLLDGGQLSLGGMHMSSCEGVRKQVTAVVVPQSTKSLLNEREVH